MPQIKLLDGKKFRFTKSINGFDFKKISKSLEKIALDYGSKRRIKRFKF